jgi:hypothetical protein
MWIIYGKSQYGKEQIDTADDKKEAHRLCGEYRLAFGNGWIIWCERDWNNKE